MNSSSKLCIAGAVNMDITGYSDKEIVFGDSNIGSMEFTPGGVARNIAENLVKLGVDLHFATLFGKDIWGDYLLEDCKAKGIDLTGSVICNDYPTSSFMAVLDSKQDLAVGIASMKMYDHIQENYIENVLFCSGQADYTVLDTNLPAYVLHKIIRTSNTKFVVDTVSGDKAERIKPVLGRIHILKTNLREARILYGDSHASPETLIDFLINSGVNKVFITLGSEGVIFSDGEKTQKLKAEPVKIINTTGAGDSFVAGLVYADIHHYDMINMAKTGNYCASKCLLSPLSVPENLQVEELVEYLSK